MRIFLGGVVAAVLASAPVFQSAPPPQTLAGVVRTGSGADARPVRRARVMLTGPGLTAPRIADTDTTGAYHFDRVAAGDLKVRIQKPGFVTLDAAAAANTTLTMTRGGAIEGLVTDAAGDPVWNVVVSALQMDAGKPKTIAQTRTDDLGRYRVHSLPAGDYFVEVASDRASIVTLFLMPGEKAPEINKAYYPAAAVLEDARPVLVVSGRDGTGVDITFTPARPVKDPDAAPRLPRPDATGTGRIAGAVTDATTGKPIRAAEILLLPAPGQGGPRLTNWTRADAQGRFEYTSLQAQRYTLQFRGQRYVTLDYGQKRPGGSGSEILLHDGEEFRADMKLPRASALEGTLFDEFGDPAPGVTVQLAQRQYMAGRYRLVPAPVRAPQPSDDRGHYRATSLPPGDYYVAALSGVYTDASEVGGFAPTYYPGTPDAGAATPLTIPIGADAPDATFALVPAKTFSVSGTMVDADGKPVTGRGTIWLMTPNRLKRADFNLARGGTAPDGTFMLRNVPQGQYTMQGFAPPPPGYQGPMNLAAMSFGWLPLAVGDAPLDGVVLKTTPGTTLRGRIGLEDPSGPPLKADQVRVQSAQVEFDSAPIGGGPTPSETHEDLTFEVLHQSGLRRILVSVQSPQWALKRITLNGQDVTDTPLDFRTKDVDGVEVTLTSKVTRVSGGVTDDKGPVADYTVVIFASDPTKWIDRSRFVAVARPTQQGRFTVGALPPEDYLAIALPAVAPQEVFDPDFLQQLRPLATSFVLMEGESKTLELKLRRRP